MAALGHDRGARVMSPQEARRQSHRQAAFAQIEFATDSPLEGDGFELFVPPHESAGFPKARRVSRVALARAQMISAACAAVLAWVQVEIRLSLLSSPSLP